MKTKRILGILLVLAMVLTLVPAAFAADPDYVEPFTDVKTGKFYTAAVSWAYDNKITSGISADTFGVSSNCTRGQIVSFLYRASGSPDIGEVENPFTDVVEGKYYYKAVLWAVSNGVTSGITATTFEPETNCTRGQIVSFLYRASGSPDIGEVENPFTDVLAGKYYYKAVQWATQNKVTAGKSATTFEPNATCTRAETVTFLYRYFRNAGTYVLMNIPYAEFYAAEQGEGDAPVDAVTSATKNKPRTGGLAGGSYHENADGTDISGVIYPVFVPDMSALSDFTEITDDSAVTITVTNRGQETTTEYVGKDALFEAPGYAYYKLSETPALYKELKVAEDGSFSFSAISGTAKTVEGVEAEVTMGGRHTNVEIKLTCTEGIDSSSVISGVVLTDADGAKYGLRHVYNIWRGTELGWNLDEYDLGGKTIKNIRYITKDAVIDYPVDITISDAGFVLMNIPYADFYGAEGVETYDVDAVASATNKVGNYGKAGGGFHSGVTAEIAEDGTVTAVGGANGAHMEGVTWPVFVADKSKLQSLGGKEITDESKVTLATLGRGATSSSEQTGSKALVEAPAYSYYVLDSAPAYYSRLSFDGETPVFSAVSGRAAAKSGVSVDVAYGTNWGDVQLSVTDAEEVLDKLQVNAMVLTAKSGENQNKAGMIHLYNLWSQTSLAWKVANTPGLDGATLSNIRYYCNDGEGNYFVHDCALEQAITPVYTGTVSGEFTDANTIALSGLPEDVTGLKAKVYYTTGGRNATYTYLTPLAVDPADDDIDPTTVEVVEGKIVFEAGSVTNNAGTTVEYGTAVEGTAYTVELSSDNYIIKKFNVTYQP